MSYSAGILTLPDYTGPGSVWLKLFFESPIASFLFLVPDGKPKARLLACNLKSLSLFEVNSIYDFTEGHARHIFRPEDLPNEKIRSRLIQILEKGQLNETANYKTLGGRNFVGETSYSLLTDEGKNYIMVTIADITMQTEANQQLAESNALFEAMTSNIPKDIICLIDPDYSIKYINGTSFAVHNTSAEALRGKKLSDFMSPSVYNQVKPAVDNAFKGKKGNYQVETGSLIYKGEVVPLKNINGGVGRVMIMVNDITEELAIRRQLIYSETMFRTLFEDAVDGFVLVISETGEIINLNQKSLQLLGLNGKENILGGSIETIMPLHFDHDLFSDMLSAQAEKGYWHREMEFTRMDNSMKFWGAVTWKQIFLADTAHCLYRITDITIEREAREQLRENETLLSIVLEESPDAIILKGMYDVDNRRCNLKALSFFEADTEAELNKAFGPDLHRYPPSQWEREYTRKSILDGNEWNEQIEYRTLKGNFRWGAVTAKKLFLQNRDFIFTRITDISEQKKAEFALIQSENRYRELFLNNPQPMLVIEMENLKFMEVNQAAIDFYGYQAEEFMQMLVPELLHESERIACIEALNSLAKDEKLVKTTKHITQKKQIVEVEVVSLSLPDLFYGGNTRIVMVTDLTAKLKAERESQNYQQFLRRIIDSDPNLIFTKDRFGKFLLANQATADLFGTTIDDITAKSEHDFNPDKQVVDYFLTVDSMVMNTNQMLRQQEVFHNPRTGKKHHFLTTKSPITGLDGEKNVLVVCADITERIHFEQELIKSRQLFEDVFSHSADALVLIDTDNNRVENCNLQAAQLFGLPNTQILKESNSTEILELIFKDQAKAEFALLHSSTNGTYYSEMEQARPNRIQFWGTVAMRYIGSGKGNYLLIRITDITAQKQIENQIKGSLAEKEILIKEIHHRVKNNMAIVSGLLHLQSSYLTDPETISAFKESQNRIKGMALIHEQLYQGNTFSVIDFGTYLKTLVAQISRSYLQGGRVKINLEAENAQMDIVTAVPCGLIINELISNACKHAFPGNRPGQIDITFNGLPDGYLIKVSDNGIGIVPEGPDNNQTPSLGMTLVKELCKQIKAKMQTDFTKGTAYMLQFGKVE